MKKAGDIYKKFEAMKSERSLWDGHWDEISQYVVPRKNNVYGAAVNGEKKHNRLYDSFGVIALDTLTSQMHSIVTNPVTPWLGFTTGDRELDDLDDVQKHLQKLTEIHINVLNNSNFHPEVHEAYNDQGSFGTSVLRVEEDEVDYVRFHARPIYECAIAENARGIVDTVYYEYELTVPQLIEKFGEEAVPKDVRDTQLAEPGRKFKVLHAVEPREVAGVSALTQAYSSVHVLEHDKSELQRGGFNENPYVVTRFSKISGEVYGRSPAMKCLADIKSANEIKKLMLESAQLQVAPPIQAPDDGVLLPLRVTPRGINFYRAGSRDRIEPINLGGRQVDGQAMLEMLYSNIEKAFYLDKLNIREADRMTATETMLRRDENLRTLSPILSREDIELLKPAIERVYAILERRGLIPPAPDAIADRKIEVQFVSQIAKAQKAAEGDAVTRTLQLISPVIEAQPEMMDNIDGDQLVRFAANIHGLPHEILRDASDRDNRRQARAQAQAEQAQMERQQQEADLMAKTQGMTNA